MPLPFPTAYPASLTDAAWQKNKSFTDKAMSATKTGIGDLLKRAEAEWKKLDPAVLDPVVFAQKNPGSADSHGMAAKQAAANPKLSADAKKAATQISTDAYDPASKLKSYDAGMFDAEIAKGKAEEDKVKTGFKTQTTNLGNLLRLLQAIPTPANWDKVFPQFGKIFGPILSACGALSRSGGHGADAWKNVSGAVKRIESQIGAVAAEVKKGDDQKSKVAIQKFAAMASQQTEVWLMTIP